MKKALIVGINYPGTANELRGCVNDANTMNAILRSQYGFADITMLLDNDATTANMITQLNALVTGAVAGDVLFFHYSGHGSQMVDTNGEEADGLDEIICPVDLNWRDKVIRDDELKAIFDKVPTGVSLTVILDCCNSGGALDQTNQYQPTVTERQIIDAQLADGRFLPPPAFAIEGADEARVGFKPKLIQSRDVNTTGLLLTGCQSHQTSADAYIGGKYQGAFTYSVAKVLADNSYNVDYAKLIESCNQFMADVGFTQRPELNGSPSLFGSKFLEAQEAVASGLEVPLLEPVSLQPTIAPPEKEESKTSVNLMIIGGIIALAGIIAFILH